MISFKQFFESLDIKNKNPKDKPAALIIGRFQPFTIGHLDLINIVKKKVGNIPIFIYIIKGNKPNPKSPFPVNLIMKIMKSCINDKNIFIEFYNMADIPKIVDKIRDKGYEVKYFSSGPDRYEGYLKQINRYKSEMNWDIEFIKTTRNENKISGSIVRQAIANNDENKFKQLTPKCEWKYFNELKKYIK